MKNKIALWCVLKSNYCKLVFILSFIASYFLIPKNVFRGIYLLLGISFMLVFSFTMMCIVRNIKEKIILSKKTGGSIISLIFAILGFSALQMCGVNAAVCGSVGLGLVAVIIPNFALGFLNKFSVLIIVISIVVQLISLYFMDCYKRRKISQ